MTELMIKTGNRYRRASAAEVCEAASAYLFQHAAGATLESPNAAKQFLRAQGGLEREQFGVIYLDTRHRVLRVETLFSGTINGAPVYPRDVVKAALRENAAKVMVFHNHPSGSPEPSEADKLITERLHSALALVDIRLLDHLIIAGDAVTSLAERGLI